MKARSRFSFELGNFLNLLRVLFPYWNFFDRLAHSFELEFKVPGQTHWAPVCFHQNQKRGSLFLNPQFNKALAEINILEHFVRDIQELESDKRGLSSAEVQALTTFKMTASVLENKLREYNVATSVVQFKIVGIGAHLRTDVYISDWIKIGLHES